MDSRARRDVAARVACAAVALLFAFTVLGGLSGCKFTSVLTQQVEDEQAGELDETANPIYRDTAGAPEDPTRTSSTISDSDRIDAQDQALPVYAADAPADDPTDIREQRFDSADTDNATTGNQLSYAEGTNEMAGEGDAKGDSASGEGEGEGESSTDASTAGDGEPGDLQNLAGGIGGTGETFDTTGTDYELPEGVSTVATAGQYALVVQMMAGRGALVAADDGIVQASEKLGAFPGEGVEDLPRAFSGDAESGFEPDIDALLAAEPDAVLVDNALVKLDDDQAAQLQAAGIHVVVLPQLGKPDVPDEDVVKAVSVVGELLAGAEGTQYDPAAMAEGYERLHDDLIEACLQANSGYSYKLEYGTSYPGIYQGTADGGVETANLSSVRRVTAFIDSWTNDVKASSIAIRRYGNASLYLDGEEIDASEGAGLSVTTSSRNFVLLDYYLQVAGVTDNSYEGVKPVPGGGQASDPYLVVAGGTRNLITDTTRNSSRTTPSALWFPPSSIATASNWMKVGDADFPLLLVRSDDIAQRVVASANKVNGLYNVGAPYTVRVVPTGVCGSWADGTVESFLVASWTEGAFKDDGNLERCKSYADQFYKTFYRCASEAALSDFDSAYTALCTVG